MAAAVECFPFGTVVVVGRSRFREEHKVVAERFHGIVHRGEQTWRMGLGIEQFVEETVPHLVGIGIVLGLQPFHQTGNGAGLIDERSPHLALGEHTRPCLGQFHAVPLVGALPQHPGHKVCLQFMGLVVKFLIVHHGDVGIDIVEPELVVAVQL